MCLGGMLFVCLILVPRTVYQMYAIYRSLKKCQESLKNYSVSVSQMGKKLRSISNSKEFSYFLFI